MFLKSKSKLFKSKTNKEVYTTMCIDFFDCFVIDTYR